jgi:hypothetical protein
MNGSDAVHGSYDREASSSESTIVGASWHTTKAGYGEAQLDVGDDTKPDFGRHSYYSSGHEQVYHDEPQDSSLIREATDVERPKTFQDLGMTYSYIRKFRTLSE